MSRRPPERPPAAPEPSPARSRLEELELANQSLLGVIQESAHGILVVDTQGRVLLANPAAASILGRGPDELIGLEMGIPLQSGNSMKMDLPTPGGATVPVEVGCRRTTWQAQPAFCLSLGDLTVRKSAEQALAESEKKYRSLYSSIRDAILVADTNRRITDCNPAFSLMFGYSLEEIKGKETSSVYASQEDFLNMGRELQEHYGDNSFLMMVNYRRANGEVFPGETSVYYLHGDEGQVTGFIGLIRDISDRVAAEQALTESAIKFRTAFESAPEGMALVDAERRFIRVNQRVCEILGYSEAELLGKSFNQFTHPDDRQSGRDRWEQIFVEKIGTNRAEKRFVHKNGDIVWVLISNAAIRDEQGNFAYVLSHIYDITQRVQYQREIIRQRDLSQKYLDTAGVILLALDQEGRIQMINRQGCKVLGCGISEAVGRDWFATYIPRQARSRLMATHRNLIEGSAKPQSFEEGPVIAASGEPRLIRWFHTALKDSAGNITGTLSSGEDITEHKAAQEAVNLLAAIVESSQDAIYGTDQAGNIIAWNAAAEHIYGYSPHEALGRHLSFIVPEDKRGEFERAGAALVRGESIRIHETTRRCKDGSEVEVSLSMSPVRGRDGQVKGGASIAHVITEIKKARQDKERLEGQLRQVQKMEAIGTLAGGIAHDFNNILAAIMGYGELALDHLASGSEAARNVETLMQAANRAKELTYQILSFSRQTEHQRVELDLEPLIKEILKMLRATLPSTIEMKQSIPAGTGEVLADPVQIHQVVMNLCTNAAQAMEENGGVLSVALEVVEVDELAAGGYWGLAPGRYQRFSVSDTGVGMSPETTERIFEPFFTTKQVGKGTGMGLSVVHGIVSDYGGTITVYSEPGQGSTFKVYLPLAEGRHERPRQRPAAEPPQGQERILFVDDERALVDIGQRALTRLGYQVEGFTSAEKALEAFQAGPDQYDLVITDYTMPKMTGAQLANQIRATQPDIPIIMSTGFSERLSSMSLRDIGVDRLTMKPLMPREIARIIREVLEQRGTARARPGGSGAAGPDQGQE